VKTFLAPSFSKNATASVTVISSTSENRFSGEQDFHHVRLVAAAFALGAPDEDVAEKLHLDALEAAGRRSARSGRRRH